MRKLARDGDGAPHAMTAWRHRAATSPLDEIDDVLAIEEASFTNPWTREMYLAELENHGVSFCLRSPGTESRPASVGFCSFWRVLDELHINNLAVLPAHRRDGRGLGAALPRAAAKARARGRTRATLEVRESNEAARRLYERFGFSRRRRPARLLREAVEDALVLCAIDEMLTSPER